MSVLIKNMEMPKGCIYANDNDQTEYCPLLNHDDVPFCQYIESEPEIAIGIGERPVYCPLSDVPEPCENTVSRQAAIDVVMQYCPDDDGSCSKADRDIRELLDDIENLPSHSHSPEIIRCKDCIYYDPPHVENNGARYEYDEMPVDAFDALGTGLVNAEYGTNIGGRCCVDYYCKNYSDDKRVFVREDNYCGRAERRTDGSD